VDVELLAKYFPLGKLLKHDHLSIAFAAESDDFDQKQGIGHTWYFIVQSEVNDLPRQYDE